MRTYGLFVLVHRAYNSSFNSDSLIPVVWGSSFENIDIGNYPLPLNVSRKFETQIGNRGDTVLVPITPNLGGMDRYTPGADLNASSVTITQEKVSLNHSERKTLKFNARDLSLPTPELQDKFALPAAKAVLQSVSTRIYEALMCTDNMIMNLGSQMSTDLIVDAGVMLSDGEVDESDRILISGTEDHGSMLKIPEFQSADRSGDASAMRTGELTNKFGFSVMKTQSIKRYVPSDLIGAVDSAVGYAAGKDEMDVKGFDDGVAPATNPLRPGDVFRVDGETGDPYHTVISTEREVLGQDSDGEDILGNTLKFKFAPALASEVLDDAAITVTPTKSTVCYHPSAVALAARPYERIPENLGVQTEVIYFRGVPIRISIWQKDLSIWVQYDILFGVKCIHPHRIARIIS